MIESELQTEVVVHGGSLGKTGLRMRLVRAEDWNDVDDSWKVAGQRGVFSPLLSPTLIVLDLGAGEVGGQSAHAVGCVGEEGSGVGASDAHLRRVGGDSDHRRQCVDGLRGA